MNKHYLVFFSLLAGITLFSCSKDEVDVVVDNSQSSTNNTSDNSALKLSNDFGLYTSDFTLTVEKADPSNTIYYTVNGSPATIKSSVFPQSGLTISNSTSASSYKLVPNIKAYDGGVYNYGYLGKGCPLSLLEINSSGDTVAQKRGTFIILSSVPDIPVVCLSASVSDWIGTGSGGLYNTYPDLNVDEKYRAQLEFYNVDGSSFNLNTQMKRGGNWTRAYPCRTININFNKDQYDNKNEIPDVDIFNGRQRMNKNGYIKGSVKQFRLHSGGNSVFTTLISDAFVHQMVSNKTNVATMAWRPCILYLNAEYWGLYQLREHYSDVYFQNNYGVDKDDILYVDKVYNGDESDLCYKYYKYQVQEGQQSDCLSALDQLYSLLGYTRGVSSENTLAKDYDVTGWELTGENSKYAQFCKIVDVESLIDLVLIQGFCSNWDFMYNNLRMWRTKTVGSGKYNDGKWRFMLHDIDFAFEDGTADNFLKADDGTSGDGLWASHSLSVFDYYAGNAYLTYGSVQGYLKPYNYLLFYLPMQNPEFKQLIIQRAQYILELFNQTDCKTVWNSMVLQIDPYIGDFAARWGRDWYSYQSWKNDLDYRYQRIESRRNYFMLQLKSAFGIE